MIGKSLSKSSSFKSKKEKSSYFSILIVLIILAVINIYALLMYNNPVSPDSPSFIPIIKRRQNAIIAMAIASICQGVASISFQSLTNNRIITPSILGFEAIYSTINTSIMYFLGINGFLAIAGMGYFVFQILAMVGLSLLIFMGVLNRNDSDINLMLLIGVILGQGLRSVSSFMRRLLSPSEFDILQAKLFASVNNSSPEYFMISFILVAIVVSLILINSKKLDLISLGRDTSIRLGLNYKLAMILILIGSSILISISTALLGPMTFFGFLIAILTYEIAKTYDHRYMLVMAMLLGFVILSGAYFLMNHIFNANGVVSVLIELVGGISFLILILKDRKI